MDKVAVKVISTVVLFIVTLAGGVVPFFFLKNYLSKDKTRADDKIKLLKSFAAGVFLGTCLLHLLPEARHELLEVLGQIDYPVTELIVGLGFLLLFVIENIVVYCQDIDHDGKKDKARQEPPVRFLTANDSTEIETCSPRQHRPSSPTYMRYGSVGASAEPNDCNNDGGPSATPLASNGMCKRKENKPLLDNNEIIFAEIDIGSDKASLVKGEEHHHHSHNVNITGLRSIMLLMALSLHTVFDGLVVGLQSSSVLVWTLLITMSVHKALVAFSLGLNFLESHFNKVKEAMVYLFVFSMVAPAGVAIGTIVTEVNFNPEAKSYCSGILQAVATGTFMYVTFMEGLRESFVGKYHLLNVFMVIASFGCICALRFAANDE